VNAHPRSAGMGGPFSLEDRWCGFFLPGRQQYRSPQRASVIFVKMMRIFESRLFWPMEFPAPDRMHDASGSRYS